MRAVAHLCDLLRRAERPVVIAGSGVWWSAPKTPCAASSNHWQLPLYTITMARGAVSDLHPLCLGYADPGAQPRGPPRLRRGRPLPGHRQAHRLPARARRSAPVPRVRPVRANRYSSRRNSASTAPSMPPCAPTPALRSRPSPPERPAPSAPPGSTASARCATSGTPRSTADPRTAPCRLLPRTPRCASRRRPLLLGRRRFRALGPGHAARAPRRRLAPARPARHHRLLAAQRRRTAARPPRSPGRRHHGRRRARLLPRRNGYRWRATACPSS